MTKLDPVPAAMVGIAAVERDCGLSKDTLRAWERRYGFPRPERDAQGERAYPADQVMTLRLLRRLIDAGHRPSKVVGRPDGDLMRLIAEGEAPASTDPDAEAVLAMLRTYEADRLHERLSGMLVRDGLRVFASKTAPRLIEAVGASWARGELEIHQEHLFTEAFTTALRGAVNATRGAAAGGVRPLVLLTTLPQEPHALGLLMAEAVLNLEGCRCISLGVQTPVADIAAAAGAHDADILALSFSSLMTAAQAQAGLAELRRLTPKSVEIWAGGSCAGLRKNENVLRVQALDAIGPAVADWRARRRWDDQPLG